MSAPREGEISGSASRLQLIWPVFRREALLGLILFTLLLFVPGIMDIWPASLVICLGAWFAMAMYWSVRLLISALHAPLPEAGADDTRTETANGIALIKPRYAAGRRDGVLTRSLFSPPGWRFGVLTGVVFALSCWSISVPGSYFGWVLTCDGLWLLIGLIWLVRLIIALATTRREIRWRNWLIQPAFVVALAALAFADAPLRTSYLINRGAMNAQARAVLAGKDPQTIHRIGLYRVSWAQKTSPTSFQFIIDGAGFIDPVGFAYSKKGPPPAVSPSTYEHWDGPWYTWTEKF
jgi:hypothetical protein